MKPEPRFQHQAKYFWANVRTISEAVGYTDRKSGGIKTPDLADMAGALQKIGLEANHILDKHQNPTAFGRMLAEYFAYRARSLNEFVEPRLMDLDRARSEFERLYSVLAPQCPIPMNKQSGNKKAPAYFTGIVNMLIEATLQGLQCDYGPRKLITVTREGVPLRTLARQVDGAFPGVLNPIAVWEIKEYYNTTTFGSRVADGIYETLLDGMELEDLREHEGIHVRHYLMVDSHYTWWSCGRSYLCRIIDMLHMRYVDEVLFGYEVVEQLPSIVKEWATVTQVRGIPVEGSGDRGLLPRSY